MSLYQNPFTGSDLKVTEFKLEDNVDLSSLISLKKEDENERFILFENGLLVRKTKSETKYFPNSFSN